MGKSKDLATGETRFVNTAGDTMTGNLGIGASPSIPLQVEKAGGGNFVASFQNTTSGTPYGVHVKDASSGSNGYPLFQVTNGAGNETYFRVDSGTGFVIKPKQPCAVWGHSTNYTLTQDSSWRDIALNTTVFDKANNYSTSTYRFTAPVAGVYLVGFSGEFHSTSNTVWSYLVPRINGSNTANLSNKGNYMADFTTSGTYSVHHQTWFLNLAANDYFVFSHIGSGGNLTLRGTSEAQFFATLLG